MEGKWRNNPKIGENFGFFVFCLFLFRIWGGGKTLKYVVKSQTGNFNAKNAKKAVIILICGRKMA